MAYRWFAALHCDVAIIETGLGGELDGTNIVDREKIAVLTAIGYDHRKLLGNSLKTIAEAKVGIVTPTTVHAFAQDPSLLKEKEADRRAVKMVITQHCAEKNVPVTFVSPTLVSSFDSTNLGRYTLAVAETGHTIEVPLVGSHQAINTALAVEVAMWVGRNRWLGESKLMTEINNLNQAQEYVRTWQGVLQTFRWPGRFTLCCTDPALYFDGAHNPSGVREMCHTLATLYPGKKVNLVLGVLEDKDWQDICDIILTENHFTWHNIYCVTPPSERALDGQKLQSYLINLSGSMSNSYNELNVVVYKVIEGILAARDHSLTTSEPVIICGSLYIRELCTILKIKWRRRRDNLKWSAETLKYKPVSDQDVINFASPDEKKLAIEKYNRAVHQIQNGNADMAAITLRTLVREYPLFVQAAQLNACCQMIWKDIDNAVESLNGLLKGNKLTRGERVKTVEYLNAIQKDKKNKKRSRSGPELPFEMERVMPLILEVPR